MISSATVIAIDRMVGHLSSIERLPPALSGGAIEVFSLAA